MRDASVSVAKWFEKKTYLQIPRQRVHNLVGAHIVVDKDILSMRQGLDGLS